jgi:hypothetical protein
VTLADDHLRDRPATADDAAIAQDAPGPTTHAPTAFSAARQIARGASSHTVYS